MVPEKIEYFKTHLFHLKFLETMKKLNYLVSVYIAFNLFVSHSVHLKISFPFGDLFHNFINIDVQLTIYYGLKYRIVPVSTGKISRSVRQSPLHRHRHKHTRRRRSPTAMRGLTRDPFFHFLFFSFLFFYTEFFPLNSLFLLLLIYFLICIFFKHKKKVS